MNETGLQDALKNLLDQIAFMDAEDREEAGLGVDMPEIRRVSTFEEEGVLTRDAGLVIRTRDAEFQMTIIRSR